MVVDRRRIYHKRDRLKQLRTFCYVARLGSMTEAAMGLGVTQPAVSLQVRELEYELEAVLLDRSRKGSRLTGAGVQLYEMAEPLVKAMDELSGSFLDAADYADQSRLHIAASVAGGTFVLPPLVKRFLDCYPGARVRVRNCPLADGWKLLLRNEVECAVGVKDSYPKGKLHYNSILTYDLMVITPLHHPLARRSTVSREEIAEWPSIVPAAGTPILQSGESADERLGMDVKAMIRVPDWEVIKNYVKSELGIAVVPSFCVSQHDQVSVVPLEQPFRGKSIGVYTRRKPDLSVLGQRFLRLVTPNFSEPFEGVPNSES